MRNCRPHFELGAMLAGIACAGPAAAASTPPPTVRAATFEVRLNLPEGRWLARQLIELGIADEDAGEAAKLAVGHLGQDRGGCVAKVAISKPVGTEPARVDRIT